MRGAFGLFVFVYSSDHFRERYTSHDPKIRYAFTHICLAGAFSAGPLIVGWLANNTPLLGPRSLIIGINGYSNIAGVIAGQLFKVQYAPSYGFLLKVTMILVSVGMLRFLTIRGIYMYTNNWRARKVMDLDAVQIMAEDRGDQRWTFVYSY
jgi:hypothetical protein